MPESQQELIASLETENAQLKAKLKKFEDEEAERLKPEVRVLRDDHYHPHENEFGTFVAGHRRYNIGDLNGIEGERYLEELEEGALKVTIYGYDHGGLAMSTSPFSCPWDSGVLGFWTFTSKQIIDIYGEDTEDTRNRAREHVSSLCDTKNDIHNGNVWGYEVHQGDEVTESCWGFVGDEALEDMRGHLPEELHDQLEEAWGHR